MYEETSLLRHSVVPIWTKFNSKFNLMGVVWTEVYIPIQEWDRR